MKKIIGLAVALVVILGIGFGLTTKADEITVDDHNINQDEYVKDEGTKAEEEIPVDSEVEVEDEVDTADVDKAPAKEEAVTEAPDTTETYQFEETKIIESKVDMNGHTMDVVEDNPSKRIMLIKDENGHKQYKTIYVKKKNFLKIIDLNGGMIFKGKVS
ncbi:MAG TPA: hypothetical protein H9895_10310 [Candidatus Pseudogracilibacillus intestinigallinarum]|uniref:Uncharacterized protein n=1 Tax=Candidatus Pseudogracilibacillus intestinigallinarum TaxID=2838742 RepID=A0A9D1TLJ1_9BACI|nr:hypothetical protein [Candidatus Pseudogracilibacillus intestinigallinarum]